MQDMDITKEMTDLTSPSNNESTTTDSHKQDTICYDIKNVTTGQTKQENVTRTNDETADCSKCNAKPYIIKQRRNIPPDENMISDMKYCKGECSPLAKCTESMGSSTAPQRRPTNASFENSWRKHEGHQSSLYSTELHINSRAEGLRSKSYKPYTNNSRTWNDRSQKRIPSEKGTWREHSHKISDDFRDNLPDFSDEDILLNTMTPDVGNIRSHKGSSLSNQHTECITNFQVGKSQSKFDMSLGVQTLKKHNLKSTLSKPLTLRNLKDKEPKAIVIELTKSELTLKQCVEKAQEDKDYLEQFSDVLANAFACDTVPHAMIMLFETLKEYKFFDTLALFFFDMQDHIEDKRNAIKCEKVIKAVLQIAVSQLLRNPSSVTVFARVHKIIGQIINDIKDIDGYFLDDETQTHFELLSKQKKEAEKVFKSFSIKDKIQPPENFREIQVIPGLNEIRGGFKPFLRANKVEGKYDDLEHYLDVQFRLLREDFVGPLREGISEYIKSNITNQNRNDNQEIKCDMKIYTASVHSPAITDHGYCLKMKLEFTKGIRKINWSVSKRLIYGSLLCLTDDDFETFILATVIGRDDEDIKQGFFTIQLYGHANTLDILHKVFKIAETSSYFESYKHVLTGLQKVDAGDMPFEKYIVYCDNKVDKPAYLTSECTYDLRPLVEQDKVIIARRQLPDIDVTRRQTQDDEFIYDELPLYTRSIVFKTSSNFAERVNVLDTKSWPAKESLHLDESQYNAVKTALSKEFSIIQGPPGTGKTYIGLQIARALLHNLSQWQMTECSDGQMYRSPMLIVCYTNHALDQFLEGVHSFFKGDILRVGGRSKSEVLNRCNLRNFRHCGSNGSDLLREIKIRRSQIKLELDKHSHEVSRCSMSLELYQNDIIHEDFLFSVMDRRFYNSLIHANQRGTMYNQSLSKIVEWLGITTIAVDVRRKVKNERRPRQSENVYVPVDDELSERRDIGKIQKYKGEMNLVKEIRRESIAYFVEDVLIQNKVSSKEEQRRLAAEKEFRALLKRTINEMIISPDVMNYEESNRINNIWRLSRNDRWRLYRMWLYEICRKTYISIDRKKAFYESLSERYRDTLLEEDKEIMRNATVIGMTTSCAAKYQTILREIGPKIIIVEEAAEVLEAHIVTTLSKSCQHLILIGDHKQLRPNPSVYKLAVRYNLNISLFERMIENGINFSSLKLQHRMRPEIAGIMRHIYPALEDNDNVKTYPNVKGVSTNLFFIHHEHLEENNNEMKSYSNFHEALFVVGFCRYLILQEYKKERITVLTTYTGQLICIRNLMPFKEFEGVRVTVVDNYQGEENDIVILSLVRSNQDNKIGFLKTDNRICVALSRAKVGFYVIGNFKQYAENSTLWKTITDDLRAQGKFGDALKLYCQNHTTEDAIIAREGKDFRRAPNGGCSKQCDVRLQCGHVCQQFCHVSDTQHLFYKCRKPCKRVICEKHKCPDDCYKECRPCQVLVTKIIPKCGHEQNVKCYLDPKEFVCQEPCSEDLPCGHRCRDVCGAPHTKECLETITRQLPCGHTVSVKCYQKTIEMDCPSPCQALLNCEHLCGGTCGQCYRGRVHAACKHACKRILVCGHECSSFCNNCPPCKIKCENRCVHSLCQNNCGELCVQCQEPCEWYCDHFQCSKLCCEPCDRPRCNEPCDKLLQCGHKCMGLCGEPCAEFFCRECNFKEVTEILFGEEDDENARFVYLEDCGHNIESKAMDTYMDMKDEIEAVQLKGCPKCKTPIRKCLRYGSVIKESLRQIEMVKKAVKEKSDVDSLKVSLSEVLRSNQVYVAIEKNRSILKSSKHLRSGKGFKKWIGIKLILSRIEQYKRTICTETQIVCLKNQRMIYEAVVDVVWKIKQMPTKKTGILQGDGIFAFFPIMAKHILKERDTLSDQELDDYKNEIRRGNDYVRFTTIKEAIQNAGGKTEDVTERITEIDEIFKEPTRYDNEKSVQVKQKLDSLKDLTKIGELEIDEEERLEIVKAMGLTKGHWFKCPNNHIYAIGECGGAMERGKCPECKEDIGGSQHRLTDGNKLASEMDGASYAAYSEEANNMANFDLGDLQ